MTIALVQEIGSIEDPGGSATTTVWTGSKTVTLGNSIILAGAYYEAAGSESVEDNLGNTYTMDARYHYSADTSTAVLYRATITTGGTLTTVTHNHPANNYNSISIAEFSGVGAYSSNDLTNTGSGTTGTWASSITIPANGAAFGAMEVTASVVQAAGSASGSPSTSMAIASQFYDASNLGSALLYAIAGGSQVTGFNGTATFASSVWNGVAAIYDPAPSVPAWTTPADTVSMSTTPELKFTSPASAAKQHFYLQLDTANTFDTGNLRTLDSSTDQTGWTYWNGSAWTALPADGLPVAYAGNEVDYTVTSALTSATWYRRVRAGTLV